MANFKIVRNPGVPLPNSVFGEPGGAQLPQAPPVAAPPRIIVSAEDGCHDFLIRLLFRSPHYHSEVGVTVGIKTAGKGKKLIKLKKN